MRPNEKTLDELRTSLATSLGFGAMAGTISLQIPILTQFLQQAQSQLWHDLRHLNSLDRRVERVLGANQAVLDMPEDLDVGMLRGVYVKDGTRWVKLFHGLPDEYDESYQAMPTRYGINARHNHDYMQVEFYPVPLEPVPVRMAYKAHPRRFTQNDDRASVPSDLLLVLAVAMGKAHYRQPDVQMHTSRFENMLRSVKAANFGSEGSSQVVNDDPYQRTVKPWQVI